MRHERTLAALAAAAACAAGCVYAPMNLGDMGDGRLEERTLQDADSSSKLGLIAIDGEISDASATTLGFTTQEATTAHVKDLLDAAGRDEKVKAIILRINSPGGGVTASDVIYHELLDWKKTTGKPIVALCMDVAASGGFYIAQAADRIVAHPTTITGSIGVVAYFLNVEGLGKKIGVDVTVVKSGPYKDTGNPFRAMEPAERKLLQGLIDSMYERFVDVVADGRRRAGLSRDDVKKLADGRVYGASEALSSKLVDSIGYFGDAAAVARELAKEPQAKVVTWVRRGFGAGSQTTIYSQTEARAANPLARDSFESNVVKLDAGGIARPNRPAFNYLWIPD